MRNIFMVQPNSQYGNSIYFPYAAGSLIAYAFSDPEVKTDYVFRGFFYKKERIEDVLSKIEDPFLVGFSCYVWNYEYNKMLARGLKQKWPQCRIAFGGHQINDSSEVIGADFVDFVTLGEGEESFRLLLLACAGAFAFCDVPNLIWKRPDGMLVRNQRQAVQIPHRVSPYLNGFFDSLVEEERELSFSAILETNRGCPNHCAFCDWGNIKERVRLYDLDMVKAEIDWMSKHKIEYCYSSDANFGLYSRDMEIVDYLIKKNKESGYPQKFQATYSKNNPETVFEINCKLNQSGMSKGATLSFQSMNEQVLMNIGRKNMPLDNFKRLMELYHTRGIPTYSEIIIGMPGENYNTLSAGIEELFECGQHMAINFYNCELLSNSLMNTDAYIQKYKIKWIRTPQNQYHIIPPKHEIPEYSKIIVSTYSMTKEDWIRCNLLSIYVRCYHNLGLLQMFAIFLHYQQRLSYIDFYESVWRFSLEHPNSVCGRVHSWLQSVYEEIIQEAGSLYCTIPEFGDLTWPLEEGAFLTIIKEYDLFYEELFPLLKFFIQNEELFHDLFCYQKAIVKNPYTHHERLHLSYDLHSFFEAVYSNQPPALVQQKNTLVIDSTEVSDSFEDYAKHTIWFGRKGGQNIIRNINKTI